MAKSDAFPERKRPFEAAAACAFASSATSSRATSAASASRERAASWALMAAVSRASSSTNMIGLFLFVRRPKSFQTFSYGPASSEVFGIALGWGGSEQIDGMCAPSLEKRFLMKGLITTDTTRGTHNRPGT